MSGEGRDPGRAHVPGRSVVKQPGWAGENDARRGRVKSESEESDGLLSDDRQVDRSTDSEIGPVRDFQIVKSSDHQINFAQTCATSH